MEYRILEGAEAQHFLDESFVYLWPSAVMWKSPDGAYKVGVKWLPPESPTDFDPHIVWRQDFDSNGLSVRLRIGIRSGGRIDDPIQCGLSARTALRLASKWGLPG